MRPDTVVSTQPAELLPVFQRLLPTSALLAIVTNAPGRSYRRIFTPLVILWGFVHQQLSGNGTCDSVLGFLSTGALDEWDAATRDPAGGTGRRRKSSGPLSGRVPKQNSSYCQGRTRLPLQVLNGALSLSALTIQQEIARAKSSQGDISAPDRPVLLVDGSTLLLQAQPTLREHYGCHANQNGPGHWPVLRMVAAFDLFTGALMSVTEGTMQVSEQALAVRGMGKLAAAAILPAAPIYVGDRNFGVFGLVHGAAHHGGDVLTRLTESRFKACLKRAGVQGALKSGEECAVAWHPSPSDKILIAPDEGEGKTVGDAEISATKSSSAKSSKKKASKAGPSATEPVLGRFIFCRLERAGYRPVDLYLFTTLMDEKLYPAQALVDLYGQRWHVELALRHVKAALGLSQLQARSVEMARKELVAGCLCYNLIRGLMAMAALRAQMPPLDLSFKRCWTRIQAMAQTTPQNATPQQIEARLAHLLKIMSYCTIYRTKQQRTYQRAVRKKPCPFPVLVGERTAEVVLTKS